jgi:signal transduction histidine kinase
VLRPDAPRWGLLPRETPRPLLLFVPGAILVAAVGGLLIFRPLVRRIQALEELARRVGRGDLKARIDDPGEDEIGRLGAQMNEMSAKLERARAELQAVDQQRRRLLGDISHELATPLTTIRGYAETLIDPGLGLDSSERRRFLGDVLAESERMQGLLQDLLELSRLESGSIELQRERIDVVDLFRRSVERLSSRFDQAGLGLRWVEGSADRAEIYADGRRIEQIADNLLGNALRYATQGTAVHVGVRHAAAPDREGRPCVELTVEDDGSGFSEEDLPHVFERFFRGDRSRATEGSGLGLAIVREIALRHGGDVRAENRSPHGARIVVVLPAS